jgi:LysM repeat protein
MKNPMHKLRRFFVRTRTYKASAAQAATQMSHEEDDGSNRLSGAFLIVLFLHIIAIVGMFAFARIKENRAQNTPPENPAVKAAAKPLAPKPAALKPVAPAAAATIAAATPAATPHDSPKPAATPIRATHIVKEGDTLVRIATAYNIAVPDIVSANRLKSPTDIHPGQALTLPGAKQLQKVSAPTEGKPAQSTVKKASPTPSAGKSGKSYTVRNGDSPMKIARENGCSYEDLMKLNGIKDPKKIQTGTVLKLPIKKG